MSERLLYRAIPAGEAVRTAALYAALLLVAFFNIVFQGETLIPGNNYNSMAPHFVPENYGPRVRPLRDFEIRDLFSFANLHDCGSSWWQGEPAMELVQRAVLRGEFPLWDPYIGGGTPLAASAIPQIFFPPSLLIALVGNPPWLKDVYSLLLLLTGGFFTYVFLRKHGVGSLGSRAAGIAFMFSGAMVQTAPQFFGQTVIGFPVLLATTAWLLHQPTWRRAVLSAVVYAVIALASFPAFLVFAVLMTALYALLVIVLDGGGAPRRVLVVRLATAVLLAFGFVAFYYLPMLSVIQGAAYTRRMYEHVGLGVLHVRVIFQLLSSTLMPGTAEYLHPVVYSGNGNIYYLGISALMLAAAAFGRVFPRPILLPFQLAAVAVLLKIVGVQPIQWLGNLPVLRSLHIAHYSGVVIGFALACVAGIAVDQLVQRRLRIVSTIGAILGGGAALLLLWRISVREGAPASPQYWRWLADFRIVVLFLAIASLLLIFAHLFRERPAALRAIGVAMVALLAVEGMTNAVFIRQRRWNYWDHPPRYVRALMAHPSYGRLLPFSTLPANMNSPYSIGSTDSLMPFNSSAYTALHHRYFGSPEESLLRECSVLPSEGVLDAFAVDRIAIYSARSPLIAQALERGYSSMYADPAVLVFARRSAPRYFLTRDYALKSRADAFHGFGERPARQLFSGGSSLVSRRSCISRGRGREGGTLSFEFVSLARLQSRAGAAFGVGSRLRRMDREDQRKAGSDPERELCVSRGGSPGRRLSRRMVLLAAGDDDRHRPIRRSAVRGNHDLGAFMKWLRDRPGPLLFVLCLAAYLSNCRTLPFASAADTVPNRLIPFSILATHRPTLNYFRAQFDAPGTRQWYVQERRGSLVSLYPVGGALAALPFYVPVYGFLAAGGKPSPQLLFAISEPLEKWVASIITALAVLFFWLTIRRRLEPRPAFWIAVAFGLGTGMWATASQMLWQQTIVAASMAVALWFLTWPGFPRWAAAGAGLVLSLAVATRPTAGLLLLAGLISTILIAKRAWLGHAIAFCMAAFPLIAISITVNWYYWGHPSGFYSRFLGDGLKNIFTKHGIEGIAGLIISPNRGLLIFTPIALVGIVALARQLVTRQGRDPILLPFCIASLLHLLFAGSYAEWWGGWSFGPRYLVDILPILGLAAADLWTRMPRWSRRLAIVGLLWSVLVQWNGAFCYPASQWNAYVLSAGDPIDACYSWRRFELWEDYQAWRKSPYRAAPY